MITNSHRQSIFHFPPQFRKKTACCFIVGIALLGTFLSASAQGATFTVNSPSDVVGAAPLNDGICATTYKNGVPNGICTLRAAIEEANALGGAHEIILPPNTYLLTLATQLTISSNLTITGSGASSTIIDGNMIARAGSGVLTINAGTTVSISGATVRNGQAGSGGVYSTRAH
jgi:CSLREA domain-containing protein